MGLPSKNIIADISQRQVIGRNLSALIEAIPTELKSEARYLSKFVVGAGVGLFDYALNAVWNEVVISLRSKAISYGLDIFYDKAVGGNARSSYTEEDDLPSLKDTVLLATCLKLELIGKPTYKKLAHILDMRNDIGISHPTDVHISAYELLGWLQTSINEVLADQPSAEALQVKSFLENLKVYDQVLNGEDIDRFTKQISELPTHHCDSIIRTLFGLFVVKDTDATLFKNISLLVPIVWPLTNDEEKDRLGIILAGYKSNLHKEKHRKGLEFFKIVKGNNHQTITERTLMLDRLTSQLKNAHYSWDNFFHEAPVMEEILTYIENVSDMPPQVANHLVRTIVLFRIGKGTSYCNGVSPKARPYYDEFLKIIGPQYAHVVLCELTQVEAQRKLENALGRLAAFELLTELRKNVVNERYKECVDYLLTHVKNNGACVYDKDFRRITAPYINWV